MITAILIIILGGAFSFLLEAGFIWVLCWALNAIGITTICGVAVTFSWPLVLAIWIISALLRGIFKTTVKTEK